MPPRIARSSLQSSSQPAKPRPNPRNPKKAAKRALNAFSIAQYENPEKVKISRHRLGEVDQSFQRKRPRDDDGEDEEEEEDGEPKRRKRRGEDGQFDEGSDSEGNTWTMGHIDVDDDDDEDIDSDEAFGESDEERFEDYTFRGSSANKKGKAKKLRKRLEMSDEDDEVDMDEGDSADGEEDDDDLGDDAIDLATALDQYEEDEAEERREKEKKKKKASAFDDSDESSSSEGEDVGADGASDLSSSDEDDEDDRQAQLKDLISSLATESEEKGKGRRVEVHESAVPDEFGVARKVDLLSFKPKVADNEKKQALKLLRDDKPSKRTDIARKLDAPLPKRQQDKLDRAAANTKANETLERWTDTIKRNRRAENLMFPLQNKSGGNAVGETRLQPTTTSAPTNELESTIQAILQQSGLSNGAEDEDKILRGEELQLNKRPIEEVMKNRAQLRLARELAFREEIRAKRIKKIKSKAYRRVHRKEREKLLEKERSQLKADGVDLSEEEREHNDRRRAEERMGAKHRESKWAKGIKATGRAAWDQDALDGVTEMARRNEELRRRVEGKNVRDQEDDASDVTSEEDESDDDSDVDKADHAALQRSLGKLKNPFSSSTETSKLGQMAFMQRAEAAKRAQNDEDIERIRRELAGEDSMSDEERENATKVGRRKYGPGKEMSLPLQTDRNEFEEQPESDDEAPRIASGEDEESATHGARTSSKSGGPVAKRKQRSATSKSIKADADTPNPFLTKAKKEKKALEDIQTAVDLSAGKQSNSKSAKASALPQETTIDTFLQQRVTTADDDGWATVLGGQDDDGEANDEQDTLEDEGIDLNLVLRNQALTAKGFAGDNVAADFASEKLATIADEESTSITTHLPGWGAWTGSGPGGKSKGHKTVTKKAGIDVNKRKDKKLDRVIINEKRQKPTTKYLASQLPFPFQTREQYERSLRLPKGKEWSTKRTFQDATRPRVLVKQGIIAPLRKPLV
ncbi:Utp14 protein-domain-containing protein [Ampelomyces quisqualis]|uniref:Utp14 protein-domain-containing protein n=1 Tax=Ampelomyces quisqualis TaxID=50730 RepID=A0A6A5Q6A4_AMPQU|nr:Utp14 protein-domain-containing protein [Ampelomyces quisqualis]